MASRDKKIQLVTQEVLVFIAFKLGLIKDPPAPINTSSVSPKLIANLRKIVWTERYVALEDTKDYTLNHLAKMTATPQLYTTYVLHSCHVTTKCFQDPYEMFVRAMTLAIQFAIYPMPTGAPELLGWTLTIFTNFFEEVLESGFIERGGWKKFNKYLLMKNSLSMYSKLQQLEKQGKSFAEIIQLLEIKATPLKECLDRQGRVSAEIENHGPTLSIWNKIEATGFSEGSQFINQLLPQMSTVGERTFTGNFSPQGPSNNMAEGQRSERNNGETARNFLNPGNVEVPLLKYGTTKRIAYLEAKEGLVDLQGHFLKIEKLLDFIFGDPPEGL
ncbi:hypothetical protein JTE90_026337 [Oedothorax gibbosus]|uniref:Uncharacterized protein n=1 Tax=Oedothorax gibbosus TaxID=931172 RepID=A0AAV6U6F8_9ARAC|nr:hypothetical protein JTE90_026337 [Oedothorax gibbosus]